MLLLLAALLAAQQPFAEDPQAAVETLFPKEKDFHQVRLRDIAAYMGLHPGAAAADIGCGSGEIAIVWGRTVGPSGRVWAEDIDAARLKEARRLVKRHHARNVTVVRGTDTDPRLPDASVDAISLFWVYHELEKQQEMLARMRQALKPGGRLVILDNGPQKVRGRPRDVQVRNHVLLPDTAAAELRQAAFEIVYRDDRFVDNPDMESSQWLIVARPAAEAH